MHELLEVTRVEKNDTDFQPDRQIHLVQEGN